MNCPTCGHEAIKWAHTDADSDVWYKCSHMPCVPVEDVRAVVAALRRFRLPSEHFVFCDTYRSMQIESPIAQLCTPACEEARAALARPAIKKLMEASQ